MNTQSDVLSMDYYNLIVWRCYIRPQLLPQWELGWFIFVQVTKASPGSLHFVYRENSVVTNLSSPIGVLRGNYADGPNEEGSGCLLKTLSFHGLCLVESNRRIGSLETQLPLWKPQLAPRIIVSIPSYLDYSYVFGISQEEIIWFTTSITKTTVNMN